MELRCDSRRLFAILEEGVLEVACRSKRCGYQAGVVVLHRFSLSTGELLSTRRFRSAGKETT